MIKVMKFLPFFIILALLASCGSKSSTHDNPARRDSLSVPTDVHIVVGMGKVVPEGGVVNLASEVGGIVQSISHEAGDSVMRGEVIITLNSRDAALQVQKIKEQIATQRQQIQSDEIAVEQDLAKLQDKSNVLSTSEKLVKTGAETRVNVNTLKTDKKVLEGDLAQSRKTVSLSLSKLKELEVELNKAQNDFQEKSIKAPSDGVLLSIEAKVGGAVPPLEPFATFAPREPMIVRGEADEMFANRLAIGQKVTIHYIGNAHIITTGKIISLSPDLSNKSLFTDEPGENQDRRVRRFKVMLDSIDDLLINAKVECNIDLNK